MVQSALRAIQLRKGGDGLNQIVVVTGVSGSGKDFLLEKVKPLLASKVSFLNFGEELFERVRRSQPSVVSRDHLRDLGYHATRQHRLGVVCKVLGAQPAVLNTHVLVSFEDGLFFTEGTNRLLMPRAYIHISSPAVGILRRRRLDDRERELETEAEIRLNQDLSAFTTARVARELGSSFIKICNREDNVEANLKILYKEIALLV